MCTWLQYITLIAFHFCEFYNILPCVISPFFRVSSSRLETWPWVDFGLWLNKLYSILRRWRRSPENTCNIFQCMSYLINPDISLMKKYWNKKVYFSSLYCSFASVNFIISSRSKSSSATVINCILKTNAKEDMTGHLETLCVNTNSLYKCRQVHWEVRYIFYIAVIIIKIKPLHDKLCIFLRIIFSCMI